MSEKNIRDDFVIENFEGYIRLVLKDNKGSCIKVIILNMDQVKELQKYLQNEIDGGNLRE